MKKIITTSLAAAALLGTTLALAGGPEPSTEYNKHTGAYVEAGAGATLYHVDLFVEDQGVSGFGANAAVGYQFNPYVALEAGYFMVTPDNTSVLSAPNVSVKGILPIGNRFSLFAKLGAVGLFAKGQSAGAPFAGVGMGVALTKNLDITVQVQGAIFAWAQVGVATAGLTYHF